jgi:hypothetical protein
MLVLLAAHQGEEFVLALPAIMLVGAFFILRWANTKDPEETPADPDPLASDDPSEPASAEEAVQSRR